MPGMFDRLRSDLDARDKMAGLTPMDLLDLPDVERQIVQLGPSMVASTSHRPASPLG